MHNLILIEDDVVALRHLSKIFDWEDLGFTLSGIFTNGKAAMEYIDKNPVDLVITDIKMPAKSGLELAEECFEKYPHIRFILISAFRDFSYAQQAIRYNVIDYITKPFNISDFEKTLLKAAGVISHPKREAFADKNTLAVQQNIFSHILCGEIKNEEKLKDELNKIGLDEGILQNNCCLIIIKFKDFQMFLESSWKYGQERLYNAISLIYGTSEEVFSSIIKCDEDTLELIVINTDNRENLSETSEELIKKFEANLKSILNLEISEKSIIPFESVMDAAKKTLSSKSLIEKAKLYISNHFGETLSLKDIAAHVSLNPIYFSSFFKQQTGENFSDYLKNYRLKKALELLKNTDIPIVSICTMVGYKNTTHFYNLIKAHTNMTPNEYREYYK